MNGSRWFTDGFNLKALQEKQQSGKEQIKEKKIQPIMLALRNIHSVIDDLGLDKQRQAQGLLGKLISPMIGMHYEPFDIDGMPAAWIRPERGHSRKHAVLYCHGGGFLSGGLSYARIIASKLASATGYDVLIFEYRLAPEFSFPSQLEDTLRAWDYLMHLGYGARRVVVAGESAGGNLALVLSHKLKLQNRLLPRALICMSPWTDLAGSGESRTTQAELDPILTNEYLDSVVRVYARGHDLNDPLISPLYGDFTGFPPVFLQVGENEILYSDSVMLHEKLIQAQIPCRLEVWDDMWHVFQMFPIKKAGEAITSIGRFLLDL